MKSTHKINFKNYNGTILGVLVAILLFSISSVVLLPIAILFPIFFYFFIDKPRIQAIKNKIKQDEALFQSAQEEQFRRMQQEEFLKQDYANKVMEQCKFDFAKQPTQTNTQTDAQIKTQSEVQAVAPSEPLSEEERIKEEKKAARKLKATQKKNRENKISLYENIYTVAGYILSEVDDLSEYVKNAEEVIVYFNCSIEERRIAVEAFNNALAEDFDVDGYVEYYLTNIGKNRDYIKYVLTYALMIATIDDNLDYKIKERLVAIGKALGSSQAALKRLFQSNGAEAKFAREFDKTHKTKQNQEQTSSDNTKSNESSNQSNEESSQRNQSNDNNRSSYSFKHTDKTTEALGLLDLGSNATFEDIRRAYKKMMFKYHPDRLASQNLSEDMMAIYTDKAKSIQGAFEYLKNLYNDIV